MWVALSAGTEIGDQGVDGEERGAALALRTPAAGDGGDMRPPGFTEGVERPQAVRVHSRAGGDVGIAERGHRLAGEGADRAHRDMAHAPVRMPLAGDDDAGLAFGSAALVPFTSQIHVIRLHYRRRGIVVARAPERIALRPLGHGVAEPLVQIPGRLIAQAQPAAELDRRDRLFGAAHQVHGAEPSGQRQLGVRHHGARGDRPTSAAARAADTAAVDIALQIGAARARHSFALARRHQRRQTLILRLP